ncbi:response regulator [Desulfolutivibrio sp.]|uniref:response regulator n=1 Tax=Desulfolutivibrio sp. TaxID=2773296 RepID=UPI002F9643D9
MKSPLVLIVDDDPTLRESVSLWLSHSGYQTAQAENGRQALSLLEKQRPDLILLDLRMPVLDGFGFLAELAHVADPPPVVVISGRGEVRDVVESFRSGATDYIVKPIESYELLDHAAQAAITAAETRRRMLRAEARYFDLVQNLPLLVFALRPDLTLEFINKYCRTMLGQSRATALAVPGWLVERAHPEDRQAIRDVIGRAFSGVSRSLSMDCRFLRADGTTMHCILKIMPATADPEGDGPLVEGLLIDITDRVELERLSVQQEKLKTLGAVSAEVAHEIRNPLFSIAGFAKRLHDRHPEAHEAEIILAEAARLEALVNRIRSYLQPADQHPVCLGMGGAIAQVLEALAPELVGRDIVCRTDFSRAITAVEEDPLLLGQVVTAMVRHGVAHMPRGGALDVTAWSDNTFSRLSVSYPETEPAREPERLFLPFEKSESAPGLALARRLAQDMGGSLAYAHDAGRAVFTLTLPLFPHTHASGQPEDASGGAS